MYFGQEFDSPHLHQLHNNRPQAASIHNKEKARSHWLPGLFLYLTSVVCYSLDIILTVGFCFLPQSLTSFLLILMDLSLLLAQGLDADAEFLEGQLEVRQGLQGLVDVLLGLSRFEFLADAVFRQGVEQAAKEIAGSWEVKDGGEKTTVSISAENIIKKRGLIQIPITEIGLSHGLLKQNPGW